MECLIGGAGGGGGGCLNACLTDVVPFVEPLAEAEGDCIGRKGEVEAVPLVGVWSQERSDSLGMELEGPLGIAAFDGATGCAGC